MWAELYLSKQMWMVKFVTQKTIVMQDGEMNYSEDNGIPWHGDSCMKNEEYLKNNLL